MADNPMADHATRATSADAAVADARCFAPKSYTLEANSGLVGNNSWKSS